MGQQENVIQAVVVKIADEIAVEGHILRMAQKAVQMGAAPFQGVVGVDAERHLLLIGVAPADHNIRRAAARYVGKCDEINVLVRARDLTGGVPLPGWVAVQQAGAGIVVRIGRIKGNRFFVTVLIEVIKDKRRAVVTAFGVFQNRVRSDRSGRQRLLNLLLPGGQAGWAHQVFKHRIKAIAGGQG